MRIAAFGIHHETNTFATWPVTYDTFRLSGLQREGILRGERIRDVQEHTGLTFAGYFKGARKNAFEIVPLLFAATDPAGTISADAFEKLSGESLDLLRSRGPWDGVLLNQMGAAVSEDFPDMDGELARRVRTFVGPDVPVVMTLDLHANISPQMADQTDALVVYRTNPHLDAVERAIDACDLVARMAREGWRPKKALEMPPMVIGILHQDTRIGPMRKVVEALEEVLAWQGVVNASIGQGYPWADVQEMGFASYALHESSEAEARRAARHVADRAWSLRKELNSPASLTVEQAVQKVRTAEQGPIVLLDVGDNIGAGSAGDSTVILDEFMHQVAGSGAATGRQAVSTGSKSLLLTLRDPEAVDACVKSGIGSNVSLRVGGKSDALHGQPVPISGAIIRISDGKFEDPKPVHAGWRYFDGGTTVAVETTVGATVVLVSTRVGNMSREQFYSLGIRPEEYKGVIAKGVVSPRPAYQPIAREMHMVNTPGATSADLSTFAYRRRRVPLYPFEPEATYLSR